MRKPRLIPFLSSFSDIHSGGLRLRYVRSGRWPPPAIKVCAWGPKRPSPATAEQ
jgi:hypothetical protein